MEKFGIQLPSSFLYSKLSIQGLRTDVPRCLVSCALLYGVVSFLRPLMIGIFFSQAVMQHRNGGNWHLMLFESLFLRESLLTLHKPFGVCRTLAETSWLSHSLCYLPVKSNPCLQPPRAPWANAVCPDSDPQLGLSASSPLQKENNEPLLGLPVSADGSDGRKLCTLIPRCCSASSRAVFAPELDASPSLALPGIYSAFSSHCFRFLICPDFTSPPTPGQMVARLFSISRVPERIFLTYHKASSIHSSLRPKMQIFTASALPEFPQRLLRSLIGTTMAACALPLLTL